MDAQPECPVCFGEEFVEPVTLSCGHMLCFPCMITTRESGVKTALLCPHSCCVYTRATPLYMSESVSMSSEQLEEFGPRRNMDFNSPAPSLPSPHVTPPSSPEPPPRRRSRRTPLANSRLVDFVDVPSRPHNVERRGTRVVHEGPRERSFVDASSDEGDTERVLDDTPAPSQMQSAEQDVTFNLSAVPRVRNRSIGTRHMGRGEHMESSEGERENEEESNNQEDAIQNHTVSRRRYFKTYINIPETQKTHDTAILEADLDLMTTTQTRRGKLNHTQVARNLRLLYPRSFPGHGIADIGKIVKRCLIRLVHTFKRKELAAGRSGQTAPENTPDENMISQIIALDDSLRLNGQNSNIQTVENGLAQGSTVVGSVVTPRMMTADERQDVVENLQLQTPIVLNRRRQNQSQGRDLREASLAAHVRHPRTGHPRLETSLNNLVETASINSRSASEVNSTLAISSEERQFLRERRLEEDRRQRELDRLTSMEEKQKDREATVAEKQKDREANREDRLQSRDDRVQSTVMMLGVLSRILPGGSERVEQNNQLKNVEVQYRPEVGSEPFPLIVSLTSLQALLSDLKEYTQSPGVSGIVWEGASGRMVLVSNIEQLKFGSEVVNVVIVIKSGRSYFKLSH